MKKTGGLGKPSGLKKPKTVVKKTKAKAKAKASSSKNAALEKAAKGKTKNDLNKSNLEKLGKMSLAEKVKAAATQGGTSEEQAQILKDSLTKEEHAKVWSRHQTHLKNNPLEKGEMEGLSKKEKGIKAAQWLMETTGKKYLHMSREVEAKQKTTKIDSWMSEKQATDKFGWDELVLHCNSGRVAWRQDPCTAGVYQYKDLQDFQGHVEASRGSKWQQGQEMEHGDEEQDRFNNLYHQEAMGLGLEDIAGKGKGFGKGQGKGKGKGKEKGFGKGQKQLALMDKEAEDEEEEDDEAKEEKELKEALKKARKARDTVASTQSDLDLALEKASPKLSRQGKAGAEGWSSQLGKVLSKLKMALGGKKKSTRSDLKALLEESAKLVKGAKDEAKELKQLANKEASLAGSKRSRDLLPAFTPVIQRLFEDTMEECEQHMILVATSLEKLVKVWDDAGTFLTSPQYQKGLKLAGDFLTSYAWLNQWSLEKDRMSFHIVPKHHSFIHLVWNSKFLNPRIQWCFKAEDFVGQVSRLTHSVSMGVSSTRLSLKVAPKYRILVHLFLTRSMQQEIGD